MVHVLSHSHLFLLLTRESCVFSFLATLEDMKLILHPVSQKENPLLLLYLQEPS